MLRNDIWLKDEVNTITKFWIFELFWVRNFRLNIQFWFLGQKFRKKRNWTFFIENEKSEYHHWIQQIRITLGSKFQLKLSMLIFWMRFDQKGYFWSKTGQVKRNIESCIFKLPWAWNFSLNWPCWFFGQNLLTRIFQVKKGKSED